MKNKVLTIVFAVCLVLFMLTVCIGLPIYCRFFYYIQIKTLKLEETTGFSYDVIKTAYDEVLDFCVLPWAEFGTGDLKHSAEGAAHFADCKVLFNLNFAVLAVSGAALALLLILQKCNKCELLKLKGHRVYFWSAIVAVALPVVLGLVISIDFDKAFEIFHAIFFPGKTNWVFDPRTDEIILVMPQEFFMNCAIIIGAGLVTFSAALIATDVIKRRTEKHVTGEIAS